MTIEDYEIQIYRLKQMEGYDKDLEDMLWDYFNPKGSWLFGKVIDRLKSSSRLCPTVEKILTVAKELEAKGPETSEQKKIDLSCPRCREGLIYGRGGGVAKCSCGAGKARHSFIPFYDDVYPNEALKSYDASISDMLEATIGPADYSWWNVQAEKLGWMTLPLE